MDNVFLEVNLITFSILLGIAVPIGLLIASTYPFLPGGWRWRAGLAVGALVSFEIGLLLYQWLLWARA